MPKQSYGAVPKGRSQSLLFALLDFANDSLDADETQVDRLRGQIETQWQSSERLVVRTKLRYLQTLSRLATPDAPLTLPQIKTALKSFTDFLEILEDNRTITRGSENWHFTLTFWGDRWDRDYNVDCFDDAWESRRSGGGSQISLKPKAIKNEPRTQQNWPAICRDAINTRLTSNPFTAGDGMVFDLGDLYVPLGVMPSYLLEDNADDEGDLRSYKPRELFAKYNGNTNQSQATRIAIIGEPGAGKSTFLQQLALLLAETTDELPVWVSLADLEGRSLETYLTTTWLRQATKQFAIAPETLKEFAELIQSGRVWLLLDALDEMGDNASRAVTNLERELQGWLGNAQIVVTCRSTVWNAGKNALGYFDTYRCQSFDDDSTASTNQIETFIQQWFRSDSELGDRLNDELDRRVNRRIREIASHPLYLTLLCRTWQLTQGKLPTTKAILYRQFVEAFYEWKQDAFTTTRTQQQSLNRGLAQLALRGMQQNPPTFRFRQGEIQRCFDAIDPDLFSLALQLGWLDVVGRSESTGEKVYAFYHPTFQEYFAATAIAQGEDLISFEQNGKAIHPIFEPSWQEIILLWLGREEIAAKEKEAFMQTLMQWQDDCGGFYELRATCLIGKGLAEFPAFSQAKTIIEQLIQWRFAAPKNQPHLPRPIIDQAGIALTRSDRQLTIPALEAFLPKTEHSLKRWLAAHSLGKNHDPGNKTAIATLESLLMSESDCAFKLNLCRSLGAMDPRNELVLQTLKTILQTGPKVSFRRKAALRLGIIQPDNPLAIQTLETLFQESTDEQQRNNILNTLTQLAPGHDLVAENIQKQSQSSSNANKSRRSRQKSPREFEFATEAILKKLAIATTTHQRIYLLSKLANYNPAHPQIIPTVLDALATARRKATIRHIVKTFNSVVEVENLPDVLPKIRDIYLNPKTPAPSQRACYQLLWDWSKEVSYLEFQRLWQSMDSQTAI